MEYSDRKKIGIIGGLGPAASARLYKRITDFTDAACDQDHLEVILFSCPQIPDRTAYLLEKAGAESFVEPMNEIALRLEALGCEVLASPCNTAHARLDGLTRGLQSAQFISMIDEAALALGAQGSHTAAILATEGTKASKVYDSVFEAAGLETCWPDNRGQQDVTRVIYEQVKAGRPVDMKLIEGVCGEMAAKGCDSIVLACTELSTIGVPSHMCGLPVFDALDVLAGACVKAAGAKVRMIE